MFVGVSFIATHELIFYSVTQVVQTTINFENMRERVTKKILAQKSKHLTNIVYIGLLMIAAFFCWQTLHDFIIGSTQISASTQVIDSNDIPTLIICLKLKRSSSNLLSYQRLGYNQHFVINATLTYEKLKNTVTLLENKHVKAVDEFELFLSERRQVWSTKHQCFMIAINSIDRTMAIDIRRLKVLLSFHSKRQIQKKIMPTSAQVFVTSSPNSPVCFSGSPSEPT